MFDMLVLHTLPLRQREEALRQIVTRLVGAGADADEIAEWQARQAYLEDYIGHSRIAAWAMPAAA